MFKKVRANLNFPEMEQDVLRFWEEGRVFDKLREKNRGHSRWSFIDGPVTANNPMGVHHAWGRTYKDIFQRFKAMQGFEQRYQNGFDCQGLWVEVEVEKELGLSSKRDIVDFGLDRFAQKCRERVERFSSVWIEQSKRLGQWMDWENSYYTMSDTNIEYIWHFLKICREREWLYKGRRAMPWCTRCGTSLSQHEFTDSYLDLVHTSVFIKLPILGRVGEHMLVWTTTPWTLAANTALAVHPDLDYAKVRQDGEIIYLSSGTLERLKPGFELLGTVKGRELVGLRYLGPFHDLPAQHGIETRVIAWADVGEDEGTGVVHIAPGCGEEDYELSIINNLPAPVPINEDGVYYEGYGRLSGMRVGDAADIVFDDLQRKGMLYKTEEHEHRYPVCWRCQEELVFRLVDEWFISCDKIREPMIREARKVHWTPDYAGKRMEDWLTNMRDWCISRKRFWGLPLPFYECSCGELTVVGSRVELARLAITDIGSLPELHRPWIDSVVIRCPKCGGEAKRVSEVGDCWLDAGVVAFSTLGYFDEDNSYWRKWFPAELVIEMREQIRLWFYTMMFMSVTLVGKSPYRGALVYEKVHDEQGHPMHKSLGNAIWFDEAVEKMGADIMRWIYAGANIQANLNFGFGRGKEVARKLLTLWNVYSFFVTYATVDNWTPSRETDKAPAAELDRWVLARLQTLIARVTDSLEQLDAAAVVQQVEAFVDDLSNWYVRLSRRRFWKSRTDEDKESAYETLYTVLVTLVKLIAPVLPFTTESMYQNLVRSVDTNAPESVHLCDWPAADPSWVNERFLAEIESVMKVVRLGRVARNEAGVKVRQPLARLIIRPCDRGERKAIERSEHLILDELNVKSLVIAEEPVGECTDGKLAVAKEGGTTVALDTTLTDELILEGLAREIVRRIQNLRKEHGFDVDDHIEVKYSADGRLAEAMRANGEYIARETLADALVSAESDGSFASVRIAGEEIRFALTRVSSRNPAL